MGWVLGESFQSFFAVDVFHVQSVHEIRCPAGHHCIAQLQQDAQQHASLSHGVWKSEYDLANLLQNNLRLRSNYSIVSAKSHASDV